MRAEVLNVMVPIDFISGSWQIRKATHWYILVTIYQVLIDSHKQSVNRLGTWMKTPRYSNRESSVPQGLHWGKSQIKFVLALQKEPHYTR